MNTFGDDQAPPHDAEVRYSFASRLARPVKCEAPADRECDGALPRYGVSYTFAVNCQTLSQLGLRFVLNGPTILYAE